MSGEADIELVYDRQCPVCEFYCQRIDVDPAVARLLYPLMKACRNLLLKLLGRSRINNLGSPGNDRF